MDWNDANFAAFRRALDRLLPVAAACGVKLAVENLPPQRFTAEPEELFRLLDGYPANAIGVCFDTGHAHNTGKLMRIAADLAPRTFIMHIHDNHGEGKDEHCVPGHDTIPWSELTETLLPSGFGGYCVLEVVAKENLPLVLNSMRDAIFQTGLHALAGV